MDKLAPDVERSRAGPSRIPETASTSRIGSEGDESTEPPIPGLPLRKCVLARMAGDGDHGIGPSQRTRQLFPVTTFIEIPIGKVFQVPQVCQIVDGQNTFSPNHRRQDKMRPVEYVQRADKGQDSRRATTVGTDS